MANVTGTSSQLPIGVLTSLLAFNIILSFTASLGNFLILLTHVLCGVSVLTSTAISVDRLLVLLLRLRYRQVVTQKRVQAVILLCWVTAVSCGLVRVWSQTISQIVVLVIGLVSLVTSVFCYVKIHLTLQGNQATVKDSSGGGQSNEDEEVGGGEKEAGRATEEGVGETTGAGRDTGEEAGAEVEGTGRATDGICLRAGTAKVPPKRRIQERVRLNMVQYKKVVSSIFWLQLTLVACYAPFITVSLLRHTVLSGKTIYGLWLFTATLVYLNSSLNPFLYCWKIKEVRMAVKNTAKAFCCCL